MDWKGPTGERYDDRHGVRVVDCFRLGGHPTGRLSVGNRWERAGIDFAPAS